MHILRMKNIIFDTLKFTRRLRDSGISERQAEAIALAFREAQGEAALASKMDLQLAIAELRTDSSNGWWVWPWAKSPF